MDTKIWAHSGDSHFIEPDGLWAELLPPAMAERMPRAVQISDDEEEVHVDGHSFRRKMPTLFLKKDADGLTIVDYSNRAPGARDLSIRLRDLDDEDIWGEVVYASLGLWENMIKSRDLIGAAPRAQNEWRASEIQGLAPDRLVPTASIPLPHVSDPPNLD